MRVRAFLSLDGPLTKVADRGLVGSEGVYLLGQDLFVDGRRVGTWVGTSVGIDAERHTDLRQRNPEPLVARVVSTSLDVLLDLPTP